MVKLSNTAVTSDAVYTMMPGAEVARPRPVRTTRSDWIASNHMAVRDGEEVACQTANVGRF